MWLNTLSLRQRFLIAPLFSLALLGAWMVAFFSESQHQKLVLMDIAERELIAFEMYSDAFTDLSIQHAAIYELLSDTGKIKENVRYGNAKDRLHAINGAVRKVEEAPPLGVIRNQLEAAALREKAIAQTHAYRRAVTSAVEMTTVNPALAPSHLKLANDRFIDMNRTFTELLNVQQQALLSEVSARLLQNKATDIAFALAGAGGAILILVLSLILARVLSRGLEMQGDARRQVVRQLDAHGPRLELHEADTPRKQRGYRKSG